MIYFIMSATLTVLFGLFYFVFPKEAYAYIDPGTGSYFLQLLIAGVIGAFFVLKIYWAKVRVFFTDLVSGKRKR